MTTLDFNFVIDNIRQQISVCGVHTDISSLYVNYPVATNIKFISFANGRGQIEYNDRLNIPELFTDPQPYQVYINQWLTAMSAIGLSQPLTLAQAQAIKTAYIAAVGVLKRSALVSVTVGGIAYNWDASDLALTRMVALAGMVYVADVNAVIGSTNTLFSTVNTNVDATCSALNTEMVAMVSTVNTDADNHNTMASSYASFQSNLQNNLNVWVTGLNSAESGVSGWVTQGNMTVPAVSAPSMSHVASWNNVGFTHLGSITALTAPTLQLVPVGQTALVTLTASDLRSIMASIASQTSNAQVKSAQKQAAVNGFSKMSDVIAYDVTTGW